MLDQTQACRSELICDALRSSRKLHLKSIGFSMLPVIWPGDELVVEPVAGRGVAKGDIVLFRSGSRLVAHRVVASNSKNSMVHTQGDALSQSDPPVPGAEIVGRVSFIVRDGKSIELAKTARLPERAAAAFFRSSPVVARVVASVHAVHRRIRMHTAIH